MIPSPILDAIADAIAELELYADTDEATAGRELVSALMELDDITTADVQWPTCLASTTVAV